MFIKICGITCESDIELCFSHEVDAIGLNLVPKSKRFISLDVAHRLNDFVKQLHQEHPFHKPMQVWIVLADYGDGAKHIQLYNDLKPSMFQLHGHEERRFEQSLLQSGVPVIRALRPQSESELLSSLFDYKKTDVLLLDAYSPLALGGTGTTLQREFVRIATRHARVILAGGLTADNVGGLIREFPLEGVDVASGVEVPSDPRRKHSARLSDFVCETRRVSTIASGAWP